VVFPAVDRSRRSSSHQRSGVGQRSHDSGLASHAGNQGEEGDGEELEHLGGLGCFDLLANETDDNCWMNTPFYTQPDHPQLALALKLSGNTFLGPPFN